MAGYIGSKAVNLSTTGADINGNANIDGNLSLGDNNKAIFGAGSDLSIFHNGSASIIEDSGTGGLTIRSNLLTVQNAAGNETVAQFLEDGFVKLFHNNSQVFTTTSTGVDITGTLTSDGLTVDGVAYINANNIHYTGSSPKINMYENDITDLNTQLIQTGGDLLVRTLSDDAAASDTRIRLDHATGDISFYEDTGTTPKFFWDASAEALSVGSTTNNSGAISATIGTGNYAYRMYRTDGQDVGGLYNATNGAGLFLKDSSGNSDVVLSSYGNSYFNAGNVGIGTNSPSYELHVSDADSFAVIAIQAANDNFSHIFFGDTDDVDVGRLSYSHAGNFMLFRTNGSEHMRITSSGLVGIGTSSPSANLQVKSSTGGGLTLQADTATVNEYSQLGFAPSTNDAANPNAFIRGVRGTTSTATFLTFGTSNAEKMRIDSSGQVGIGTISPNRPLEINTASSIGFRVEHNNGGGSYFEMGDTSGSIMLGNDAGALRIFTGGDSVYSGEAEAMRIDSSGRVGIGTDSPASPLQVVSASGAIPTLGEASSHAAIGSGGFGTMIGTRSTGVGYIQQQRFDGTATAYDLLLQPNGGRVGIGTTSPSDELEIASSSPAIRLTDTNDSTYGAVSYNVGALFLNGDQTIRFNTDGAEAMRIDSSGNLLVGKTTASSATVGFETKPTGFTAATRDANTVLVLNRLTSDGDIVQFRKDGSPVGSIGTEVTDTTLQADLFVHARSTVGGTNLNNSRLWLLGGDSGIVLDGHTNAILPTDENSYEDDRTDIGSDDYRFKDLYLSGGVFLGGTGSANKLDDYEEGTFTPTLVWAQGSAPTSGQTLSGSYTKVGRLVTVTAQLYYNGSTVTPVAGTDIVGIGSLPFVGTAAGHGPWGDTGAGVQTDGTGLYNSASWSAILSTVSPSVIFMTCINVDGSVNYDDPINITLTYKV